MSGKICFAAYRWTGDERTRKEKKKNCLERAEKATLRWRKGWKWGKTCHSFLE